MKKLLLLLIALALCLVGCEAAPVSETETTAPESSAASSAASTVESSDESTPDEELSIVGTWRVVTDVSPWVKLRLNEVCPEMKIDGAELLLPVIVDIDEESVTVWIESADRLLREGLAEYIPDYVAACWDGKIGDRSLDQFMAYCGMSYDAVLEMILAEADFGEWKIDYTLDEDRLSLKSDGDFLFRLENDQLFLSAENAKSDEMKRIASLGELLLARVESEIAETAGQTVHRYYWNGKDDITTVTYSDNRVERKHLVNKKLVEETIIHYDDKQRLETILVTTTVGEKKWEKDIEYYWQTYKTAYRTVNVNRSTSYVDDWTVVLNEVDPEESFKRIFVRSELNGFQGERLFIEYETPDKNGVKIQAGFYSDDRRNTDFECYDKNHELIAKEKLSATKHEMMSKLKTETYYCKSTDFVHYVITDESEALVMKFMFSESELIIEEVGGNYRDDDAILDEIIDLFLF